jgi:hypothetical protein
MGAKRGREGFVKKTGSSFGMCFAAILVAAGATTAVTATSLKNSNQGPGSFIISDLSVWGTNGEQSDLLLLGNNQDDITIPEGGSLIWTVDFKIKDYMISTTVEGGEWETVYLGIPDDPTPILFGFLHDPISTKSPKLKIVGGEPHTVPPGVGTIIPFTNGLNPSYPDWFVGTNLDLTTGDITGAYTGDVQIVARATVQLINSERIPVVSIKGSILFIVTLLFGGASVLSWHARIRTLQGK